jgi:hypothetical protein
MHYSRIPETRHHDPTMKLFLTALLALSTISLSFADTPITEGHSYKVVNGNLVDTTASSEFQGSATTPTPIPAQQPTIIINNNVTTQTQQIEGPPPVPEPAPAPVQRTEVPSSHPWDFVVGVEKDLNDHNWQGLAPYLADGHVNYFGHRYATVQHIAQDMENDSRQYPSSQATYYADTFTHEISNEYSPHWNGPMLYDSINVYSVVTERNGRVHRALTRLTVGYTLNNGALGIYALVIKVLPTNS